MNHADTPPFVGAWGDAPLFIGAWAEHPLPVGGELPPTYHPRHPPYDHQRLALQRSWRREGFCLFLEMGTGKSKIAIDTAVLLLENEGERGSVDRLLVTSTKGSYANWVDRELPEHLPGRVRAVAHLWEGGGTKREQRAIERLMDERADLRVLVVNIESVATTALARPTMERFLRAGRALWVVDESSTIKNPGSERTQRLLSMRHLAHYRRVLSGSPMPQGPMDLWSQVEFCCAGGLGHRTFVGFRSRYAVLKQMERVLPNGRKVRFNVVQRHQNLPELSDRVRHVAHVVRKEDCLDLPPKVTMPPLRVELTPEQRRLYNEVRKHAVSQLDSGAWVSATVIVAQLSRLHQIACGHVRDEDGTVHTLRSNRPGVLLDALADTAGPSIVWATYHHDVELLRGLLAEKGLRVGTYYGPTSTDDRRRTVADFQEGRLDVFLSTQQTGGYGITLTAARSVFYYSNTTNLDHRTQSSDRPHRIGLRHSVSETDLVAPGTLDEKYLQLLQNKQQLERLVMDAAATRSLLD